MNPTHITLATLPAIGAAWPLNADDSTATLGAYAGVSTQPDGTIYALVLLDDKPTSSNACLDWPAAMAWAEGLGDGASLPTRPESALLFANLKPAFEPRWHWTCEQSSAYGAWHQCFDGGDQYLYGKDYQGRARAVRRFKLSA